MKEIELEKAPKKYYISYDKHSIIVRRYSNQPRVDFLIDPKNLSPKEKVFLRRMRNFALNELALADFRAQQGSQRDKEEIERIKEFLRFLKSIL
ncbi:MAG: hypothetical protein QIT35_gp80 [Methanophagales virus PBV299]|uniref:Uncharacterized protein n=1 Tax=Methanophagales virus PBV299 TaxID=2987730 RepID=A0ABY6GM09_9CAUD|nr:MAG: hypothetical protein QIT35_gp80 [Methanophagales virus PBV299]UYL64876.1 MAG: hypothetical protein OFDIEDLO_00080 [Methanophagales virus PBV299]